MVTISRDGAAGWGEPRFDDDLANTVCMASIIRLEDAGSVLFAAPDNMDPDMAWENPVNCDRKRLSAKLSRDDCATWSVNRVIEEGLRATVISRLPRTLPSCAFTSAVKSREWPTTSTACSRGSTANGLKTETIWRVRYDC